MELFSSLSRRKCGDARFRDPIGNVRIWKQIHEEQQQAIVDKRLKLEKSDLTPSLRFYDSRIPSLITPHIEPSDAVLDERMNFGVAHKGLTPLALLTDQRSESRPNTDLNKGKLGVNSYFPLLSPVKKTEELPGKPLHDWELNNRDLRYDESSKSVMPGSSLGGQNTYIELSAASRNVTPLAVEHRDGKATSKSSTETKESRVSVSSVYDNFHSPEEAKKLQADEDISFFEVNVTSTYLPETWDPETSCSGRSETPSLLRYQPVSQRFCHDSALCGLRRQLSSLLLE